MAVVCPETIDDACIALDSHPGALVLAGGTDVMVGVNAGSVRPGDIVSLHRVASLRWWSVDDGMLSLGAGVTYAELVHPALGGLVPVLAQAARTIGSPQIRAAGTIGGNLGTASPAGDAVVALVALGGSVVLRSIEGEREVLLDDFVLGPRTTARQPNEVITSVRIPVARGPQEFLKVGTRNAMVIAVASVGFVVDLHARSMRVVMGSVGPRPMRAAAAETFGATVVDWSTGHAPRDAAAEFGALAAAAATPIDDHRSTAAYRRRAVEVLARRAFERSLVAA